MTNNPKLNDLQLVLLSTAAQRDDGSVFPATDSIANEEQRIRKAIQPLLKRGLFEEHPIKDRRIAWREQDGRPLGIFITAAGRTLIQRTGDAAASVDDAENTPKTKQDSAGAARKESKTERVLQLLRRPDGATLNELVDATGWLPHTTRAALTGLRKKGHVVEKRKRDGATCYRIPEVA
jgi:hypothetical protein